MDPERWRRAFDVFKASIDCEAANRAAFLDEACGSDQPLRQAVDELLRAADSAGHFLEAPAAIRFLSGEDKLRER